MNNKGQTVVAFVIIVPVFILLLAFVVDTGYFLKEYTKLQSTTKTILKTTYNDRMLDNYKEKVNNLYKKNDIPFENLEIMVRDDKVRIQNEYEFASIFGKVIGLKYYKINIKMQIEENNGILKVVKE